MEDWALIRRLVADGVPQRQVARDVGIGRIVGIGMLCVPAVPAYALLSVVMSIFGVALPVPDRLWDWTE